MKDPVVLAVVFVAALVLTLAVVLASPIAVDCGDAYRSHTAPICK